MVDTIRIEAVLDAMASWQKSQARLQKETDAYDGPSLGYHLHHEISQEREARAELTELLNGFIDQRVEAKLRQLGLIQEDTSDTNTDTVW